MIETRRDFAGHRRRRRDGERTDRGAADAQKVPGGVYRLPPAAPVAQGAFS